MAQDWSGRPDPDNPDEFWIDDATGERVNARTGERRLREAAQVDDFEGECDDMDVKGEDWEP
jgi:hypothetical protein